MATPVHAATLQVELRSNWDCHTIDRTAAATPVGTHLAAQKDLASNIDCVLLNSLPHGSTTPRRPGIRWGGLICPYTDLNGPSHCQSHYCTHRGRPGAPFDPLPAASVVGNHLQHFITVLCRFQEVPLDPVQW